MEPFLSINLHCWKMPAFSLLFQSITFDKLTILVYELKQLKFIMRPHLEHKFQLLHLKNNWAWKRVAKIIKGLKHFTYEYNWNISALKIFLKGL